MCTNKAHGETKGKVGGRRGGEGGLKMPSVVDQLANRLGVQHKHKLEMQTLQQTEGGKVNAKGKGVKGGEWRLCQVRRGICTQKRRVVFVGGQLDLTDINLYTCLNFKF